MEFDSKLPGDDQTPEMVRAWVQANAQAGTVMVLRYEQNGNFAFELVEVDLMNTSEPYLYSRGDWPHAQGTFDITGFRSGYAAGYGFQHTSTRLLIPTPTVVNYADNDFLWIKGHRVKAVRPKPHRHDVLRRRLNERVK